MPDYDSNAAREKLLGSIRRSQEHIEAIKAMERVSFDGLEDHLRGYVLERFLLEENEAEGHCLRELIDMSIAKSLKVAPELVEELDKARGCNGGSSASVKKALLFQSLEKKLSLSLDARGARRVEWFSDLTGLVWAGMEESSEWSHRLAQPRCDDEAR